MTFAYTRATLPTGIAVIPADSKVEESRGGVEGGVEDEDRRTDDSGERDKSLGVKRWGEERERREEGQRELETIKKHTHELSPSLGPMSAR